MYKGNIQDFLDRLSDYLLRNYQCRIESFVVHSGIALYLNHPFRRHSYSPFKMGILVEDREDFEEQVYKAVVNLMKMHKII